MKLSKSILPVFILIIALSLFMSSCKQKVSPKMDGSQKMSAIKLSPAEMQLANITVAEAKENPIGRQLLLTGTLNVDEQSSVSISAATKGRILKLYFKNTGDRVNIGDSVYKFYSEDLISIEREYVGLQNNNWNVTGKFDKSIALENKLMLLGMLPSQIKQLKSTGKSISFITIFSKVAGIIRSVNVTEGEYVNAGQQLFDLADDKILWAEAQVYPDELKYLKLGMTCDVIIPAAEDMRIKNVISSINPAFEPGKNVTLVRTILNNPGKKLRPGMLAYISVQTQKSRGIVIPSRAILYEDLGKIVWIQNADSSFEPRKVISGIQSADSVLILSGLNQSEKVVVSGVYLLNSELILNKASGQSQMANIVE